MYEIVTTYMLDSAQEPSYNCRRIWILKLIEDMVNDSTPLQPPVE